MIDLYCERTAAGLLNEPLNAISNLGFLLVAALAWRRARHEGFADVAVLAAILAAIGVGSGLFLASFMTLLLTEDVGVISPSAFAVPAVMGCVTGSVSQTYFQRLPPSKGRNNALQC